ncbi:unnamed protein product [Linum trigynum]|uniref:Two-component response regulator n=1 Tax=Linum trigynum TaxID=586398 RepID=A0AAV2G308_9ROSI
MRALREENNYDMVVMSLHMQEVNGMEFQRQVVRELKIPVIVMSADDDQHLMLKTLEDGAIFYLLKPVNGEDLKNVWQYAITIKKRKSIVFEERSDNLYSNIEKIPCHDTKSTSSINNDIDRNSGQLNIISKVERKRGRKKMAKEDDGGRDFEDDGELHNSAKKRSKVVWTSSLHTRFLLAVNHIGLDKAVPKTILQFMGVPGLTRENIASHLQKYRNFLKKLIENGGKFPSTLSQRTLRSFGSNSSFLYRRIKLQDLDMLSRRRLDPLFQTANKSSSFIQLRHHNHKLSHLSLFQGPSNYQPHLLQSDDIRRNLTNSNQGFSRFGDTPTCNNIGTASKVGGYGYNQISGNSSINTKATTMGSPYQNQKFNFNSYTEMKLNGTGCEFIGASKPSFNGSIGLLPNVGFNGSNLGLRNRDSNGDKNVAPTLAMNEPLGYSSASQQPSLFINPLPFPSSTNNKQNNYLGSSATLCQELNFFKRSNGGMNNHVDVINMMGNTFTNLANDAPCFGEYTFNHQLHDDIEKSGLQSSNSIPSSLDTSQQEDGVRELKFSSDNAHYGDIEMNNLVTQLPRYPNFSNELSQHTKKTTNLEVNAYDQQEVGVTKIAFSSDTSHHGSIEMNNLVTQLSHPSLSDELSQHTEQTIDLEELLDASSQEKDEVTKSMFSSDFQYDVIQMNNIGSQLSDTIFSNELPECANPTNFDEIRSNFETDFNPINDKQGANDGETVELNSNDSFLAEIEAILDNKDWADQFIECLHENKDWTSF